MTRRAALTRVPERVWLVWDPDRWWLPLPWEGVALLAGLLLLVPGAALPPGRGSSGLFIGAGFVWAVVSAWLTFWWRQSRRRRRTGRERGDDWICAACLHAEPGR